MHSAFREVLCDLWLFLLGKESERLVPGPEPLALPLQPRGVNVAPSLDQTASCDALSATRTAYVIRDHVECWSSPQKTFDGVVANARYGDRVQVRYLENGYASVVVYGVSGWIDTAELSENTAAVLPSFVSGQVYECAHEATQKLRRFIRDECAGGQLRTPLQSFEYVRYMLLQRIPSFVWPSKRPRTPGTVHVILRGHPGVSMGIEPKTGALLEVTELESRGFFGIVEAVQPDLSLTLSSVGRLTEGEFRREHFTRDEWREWRPTFITIS